MSQSSADIDDVFQIIDVTDVYQEENSAGSSGMDEEIVIESREICITFPSEAESLRREDLLELPKEQLVDLVLSKERELRRRTKLIQRLRHQNKTRGNGNGNRHSPEMETESPPDVKGSSSNDNGKGLKRKASKSSSMSPSKRDEPEE